MINNISIENIQNSIEILKTTKPYTWDDLDVAEVLGISISRCKELKKLLAKKNGSIDFSNYFEFFPAILKLTNSFPEILWLTATIAYDSNNIRGYVVAAHSQHSQ